MEYIRQAIERAKERPNQRASDLEAPRTRASNKAALPPLYGWENVHEVELNSKYLQSQRIVAYDGEDFRSRPFDMLRAEVLRSMDLEDWKIVAVTSPTPSCGKTLMAINLALSIARQPDRQVSLVDLDLRKPRIAESVGLECPEGVLGILERRISTSDAIIRARIGASNLDILPTSRTSNSSDLVSSSEMKTLLQQFAGGAQSRIVILDLPPLLTGHDAISILPHVDCVLLVAAVGTSKIKEIEECNKYLQGTSLVRFVLNKVAESTAPYGYY
jgi:Mrp family chromosome partitioning ATPase